MLNISFLFRNKIKTIRCTIFLGAFLAIFFGVAGKSLAADFYIAQNASGENTGIDCVNAYAVSWLNSTTNWANPKQAGKIGPSDTAHLCGTISDPLTIMNSGSEGSPITVLLESNAKLSRPHWNGANNDSAIFGGGYSQEISYIVVDGGTNGIIEATDNGTNKTYQLENKGVRFRYGSHITVKNLTIQHLYDRVESSESNPFGSGIYFENNTHDIVVDNNALYDAGSGINFSYGASDYNVTISGNTGGRFGHGAIVLGNANTNTTLTNVLIFDNDFTKGREWSGAPEIHTSLIHAFAVSAGTHINGLKIYNNKFSGKCGTNSTSLVYLEGNVSAPRIFNNLFVKESDPGGACGNGMLYVKNGSDCFLANNTFIADGSGIGFDILDNSNGILKNNLFFNVADPVISPYDTTSLVSIDNNIYYHSSSSLIFNWGSYSQLNLSQWLLALQSDGLTERDLNSLTSNPALDVNYLPQAQSPAIGAGINLTSFGITELNVDKNGVARPSSGAWDIGAYEYVSTGDVIAPVAPIGLSVL